MRPFSIRARLATMLLGILVVLLGTGSSVPALAVIPDTGQAPNTWQAMGMVGAPSPRSWATTVWTGQEFVVWGGMGPIATWPQRTALYNDGARYNPASGTWRPMSTVGAPSPRMDATAIWTGRRLMIWGGSDFSRPLPFSPAMGGGLYDPATDTWRALPPSGLGPRGSASVVWTGKELLVWGGTMDAPGTKPGEERWFSHSDGALYNPATNTWSPMATAGAPDGKYRGIWTRKQLLVWSTSDERFNLGEQVAGRAGARYDPAANRWRPMSEVGAPPASATAAVWTGNLLLVWGSTNRHDARYDPTTDTWTPMTTVNAPTPRMDATALWTGQRLLIWGGCCAPPKDGHGGFAVDGGFYDPETDRWTLIAAAPPAVAPEAGAGGSVASTWTGSALVAWGGCCNPPGTVLGSGARYDPRLGQWITLPKAGAPSARYGATAVWTGREVLVWGGFRGESPLTDGAAYRPPAALPQ